MQNYMDKINDQNLTFSMMKAIISKKMVSVKVYELMDKISELLVRSQIDSIWKQAADIFSSFLLFYPMGKSRLEQHLDFVVNNLNYPYETGRKS